MNWKTKLIIYLKKGKVISTIKYEDNGLASGNKYPTDTYRHKLFHELEKGGKYIGHTIPLFVELCL